MSAGSASKKKAAMRAVKHIENGMVLGLGSGTTVSFAIKNIGELIATDELYDINCVPTSIQTAFEAIKAKIPLTSLDEHPQLDLGIDGADQLDVKLNAIKGGGGALMREKIVAAACKEYILIADDSKLTDVLGNGKVVPIEIHPFGVTPALKGVEKLGAKVSLRLSSGKLGPLVTDNGNYIIDADFGPIADPWWLNRELHAIPGVIETGMFLGYAHLAYVGGRGSVK
ncbi:MAG: ribose 5-phosphate isomerase A, partial [Candidatus Dadabacteria bacterium]|nr:ribose 5-phosphate isomerase A [Candidatus Dadabacteria bacterium]